ncbi:DUF7146 domain-containing protein [Novosphingobium naphthalenivorans]|uniref:DUF7146 domain-containing protein n=1 Tax=Novosphingobium naphthalenivorans TaxID=273168 RepID=UPI00082B9A05|nr:toprim domain-containing protein [Novosphingobium naphthalenivorans]
MARVNAGDVAHRLGRQAEAVCRRYLSAGCKHGNYWLVGDTNNTPGRSLFVRLHDSPKGAAGKWQDAATGEHGDLLDLIRLARGLTEFADVAEEACAFLSLPHPEPTPLPNKLVRAAKGSADAAKRLFAMSQPIGRSVVGTYLHHRGIASLPGPATLRFHPRCYYRAGEGEATQTWPAMIAAVTDLDGLITGVHRTWLAPDGADKAPINTPRKAMGNLLGHAVRFGIPGEVMAAGEGIESVLSVREAVPGMAMAAALSAAHLAAIAFPDALRRLYIIRDNDPAGDWAGDSLVERAHAAGIEAFVLSPERGDFNEDLCAHGLDALRANIRGQIAPQDEARFLDYSA